MDRTAGSVLESSENHKKDADQRQSHRTAAALDQPPANRTWRSRRYERAFDELCAQAWME